MAPQPRRPDGKMHPVIDQDGTTRWEEAVKLGWVVPRWGPQVAGGAEVAARWLAERLLQQRGWTSEVFTSTAVDNNTWAPELEPGDEEINGVTVHRIECSANRIADDIDLHRRATSTPDSVSMEEARRWIDLVGLVSPDLDTSIVESDADLILFTPYLFAPTVRGVPLAGPRSVLVPAAHDEPPIRLPVFKEVFESAGAFGFYTEEERDFVARRFKIRGRPTGVLGLGVERPPEADGGTLPPGVGDAPYILCVSRIEVMKGTRLLAEHFRRYKETHPGPLKLVMAGPGHPKELEHYVDDDILLVGKVDEPTKWALLDHSLAFVLPSVLESFSIAIMEGWLAGKPVLVNGQGEVTTGHAGRSGGGLWFDDFTTFESAVHRIEHDPRMRAQLGRRGRSYVEERFAWPTVIERWAAFLEEVAETVAAGRSPADADDTQTSSSR